MNLVFIEDKNGNKVLPITSFSSVRDTNGNNLNLVLLTKVSSSEKGLNGGVATLDNNGKIPSSLIPIDSTPTIGSDNPITSSAVYEALEGKQATIDNNHKLDADLVDDTNSTNKFTNSTEKGTWNGKQNKINVSGLLKGDGEGGVSAAISGTDYVAPETGKGLSTNDYDDAAKNKVNNIPNSPIYTDTTYSLNVGTDLDANKIILTPSTGEPDKITVPYATTAGSAPANGGNATTVNNHSVNTDVPANAVFTDTHHDGSVTADDGYVLTKVEVSSTGVWSKELVAIPAAQIQSDWNQSDNTQKDFIKNKPTDVGDFTNNAGFITKVVNDLTNYYLKNEVYTKTEVTTLIQGISQFTYQVVSTLPTASADTMRIIYLTPSSSPQTQNVKDEYITIDNGELAETRYTWEQIGSTSINLTNYYTKSETDTAIATELHNYTPTSNLATVATSGDYGDLANKPTIPAAQVNADWNADSGVAQILNKPTIPDTSDFIKKSSTVGLVKNDGTIDTNIYLTQNDISGKANKSEMSVTNGTGVDSDKTTIQLKNGTSATVLKSHQSLVGKQDVIDSSHKLSADLVDDTNSTHKFVTAQEKTTWNGKQTKITANGILKGDGNGGVSAALKQDIVDLGIPSTDTNTTYKLKIGSTTNGDSVNGVDLGTLENKSAASGGTDLSLVTTGEKYAWNNKASLDNSGKVPASQLPSYVDDVLEYDTLSDFPATGEDGKIYVDLSTDRTYRWSGTQYTPIKGDLAIGSTTGTAADGGIVNTHITDSTIHVTSTEKQTWNNKQKAIAEGRGITVTTGETADTVSLNLPIYAGSGNSSIAEGRNTTASGNHSHAEGRDATASGYVSHAEGWNTTASNECEHASGRLNVSNQASSTFGDGGNTLFSVGNGTANNARHNAFEIRQNGDIYITIGGQDVKLQDNLGNKVDKTTTVNGHALSGNVAVTKSDVGLGNVGNFKAVSTEANQGLTDTEKSNARTNLGLGSMATKSSLAESDIPSIHKSKISDFPTSLPANGGDSTTVNGHTVLSDVPANAVFTDTNTWRPLGTGATDACAGNDSRLSDSRRASDVYDWAKASTKPAYTANEVGACSNSDYRLSNARVAANIDVVVPSLNGDTQVDLSVAELLLTGYDRGSITLIYNNETSTDCIITVPTTYTGYTIRTPDGNPIELTCPAGGYCEISVLKNNLIFFIRGI